MAKVQIAINGAGGRMGRELTIACQRNEALRLAAAFEAPDSSLLGQDVGRIATGEDVGVVITSSQARADASFEVLVDFTRPDSCMAAVEYCATHGVAMVIGTTGFDADQLARIDAAAEKICIVKAANFSAGVNLTLQLLATAAKALGDSVDIEVIEAHHRHKVDAPSGTALRMGEVLAQATGRDLDDCAVYARHGHTGERARQTIGFQTLRGGDIVGEHTVLFAGDGERIEISHKASSRQTFAGGAMRAAGWAAQQAPGRYDMNDVLGLNTA